MQLVANHACPIVLVHYSSILALTRRIRSLFARRCDLRPVALTVVFLAFSLVFSPHRSAHPSAATTSAPAPNTSHRPPKHHPSTSSTPACCWFHERCGASTKARSPPSSAPAFHAQACLRAWKSVCSCIARLGKMLLYGLQGQQEGEHGEVLYDREGALFDALWELLLRFLVPFASEAARYIHMVHVHETGTQMMHVLR